MAPRRRRWPTRSAIALAMLAVVVGVAPAPIAEASTLPVPNCYVAYGDGAWNVEPCGTVLLDFRPQIPRWMEWCFPRCGPGIAYRLVIPPAPFRVVNQDLARGMSLWSQAAISTDPGQRVRLRDQALDSYTHAAGLLGQAPLQVAAVGVADSTTNGFYTPNPDDPDDPCCWPRCWCKPKPCCQPDPVGPLFDPWLNRHGELTGLAVAKLQVGLANPGRMPEQRLLAARDIDGALQATRAHFGA